MTEERGEDRRQGTARPPAIEALDITKRFPGVLANDGVSLAVQPGEVHALLGENGAGKTTLAAILTGLYEPDRGEVRVAGESRRFASPRDALDCGVGMVHQHFRLVDRFTVAENIALGDPTQPLFRARRRLERDLGDIGERYGLHVDPAAVVADLSVGERQRVEIVKTLHRGVDVLLLDEPTAVLTPQEAEALFATVRAMAADGKGVVFISHKLEEVMSVADMVTVLRDGRVEGSVPISACDSSVLARMMVGRDVDLAPLRADRSPGDTILSVESLALDVAHRRVLSDIAVAVREGEIVGIAGVSGNGQVELAETIAGLRTPSAGRVVVGGEDVTGRGPMAARRAGLAYVPEDRLGTGLAPGLSIADNLLLTRDRPFLLDRRTAERAAEDVIEQFDVKTRGPHQPTRAMSGGNVQKVLLARELTGTARALVIASPTRGLDVGATAFVRRLIDDRRRDGCAVLLISEDLDELLAMADRVLVIYEGRIVLRRDAAQVDVTELGLAMAGSDTGVGVAAQESARPSGPPA